MSLPRATRLTPAETAESMRAWAGIHRFPRRFDKGQDIGPAPPQDLQTAKALDFAAAAIERNDPHLPPEWRP